MTERKRQTMNCPICGKPMAHYRLYGYRCHNRNHYPGMPGYEAAMEEKYIRWMERETMNTETNTIPDNTYVNTDDRYGGVFKVTVDDYRDLNSDALFWADDDGIYEVMHNGHHRVAVSVKPYRTEVFPNSD